MHVCVCAGLSANDKYVGSFCSVMAPAAAMVVSMLKAWHVCELGCNLMGSCMAAYQRMCLQCLMWYNSCIQCVAIVLL